MIQIRYAGRRGGVLLASVLLAVAASGCTASKDQKVVFEVTGPATADITYGIGADQTQDNGTALPWKKELTSTDNPLITVVTAQSKGTGDIICKITIDGKIAKENKASGEFAIVTCSNG